MQYVGLMASTEKVAEIVDKTVSWLIQQAESHVVRLARRHLHGLRIYLLAPWEGIGCVTEKKNIQQ